MRDIGGLNVSRETNERLEHYLAMLRKWNPRINLVAPSTLADAWTRHFIDSVQIHDLAPATSGNWLDIGSGGGFPGMVIAILAQEFAPERQITLIESDQRKCVFLRSVARETNVPVTVIAKRIDQVDPLHQSVLSARALAALPDLLGFADRHLAADGVALFSKGRRWRAEIDEAARSWRFQHEVFESKTDPEAVVLRIGEIEHV